MQGGDDHEISTDRRAIGHAATDQDTQRISKELFWGN